MKTGIGQSVHGNSKSCVTLVMLTVAMSLWASNVKNLGTNREVMWDMERIVVLEGGATLKLHHPELREVAIVYDAPWEGNVSGMSVVLQDGKTYRMYYRGLALNQPGYTNEESACYAESDDGIHWRKPNLGLCTFNGSTANNIILTGDDTAHNFSPFIDRNPECRQDERYKAVAGKEKEGLFGFVSSDGVHWKKISKRLLYRKDAFDSLNLAFWDPIRKLYVLYYRQWRTEGGRRRRGLQMATSSDFRTWKDFNWLSYDADAPDVQLYTNAIRPYDRAYGVYIGFPKRISEGRTTKYDKSGIQYLSISDGVFMSSRDGLSFKQWGEAFLRPGLQHERWINRNNYIAAGNVVITKPTISGCPDEISLYSIENYYGRTSSRLRRMVMRLDGFVSVNAPYAGGAVTTKPLTFTAGTAGKSTQLLLNASTSGAGSIRCEIRNVDGAPIKGYSLEESKVIYGDEIDLAMMWKTKSDVSQLAGKPVILHFELKDADIYSYRFGN